MGNPIIAELFNFSDTFHILSFAASFFAVVFVVMSYFVRKKSLYLLYQSLCIVFLILSYFFGLQYFAMIGLFIGLCRSVTFFLYEKEGKKAPIVWSFVFSVLTVTAYVVVNYVILKEGQPLGVLCMAALVMYAFIFRIRNLRIVRFTMLAPTFLSIAFNVLTHAAIFATLTYVFELGANLVAIVKYDILRHTEKNVGKAEVGEAEPPDEQETAGQKMA